MRSHFQSTSSHSPAPDSRSALSGSARAHRTPHSCLEIEYIKFTDPNGVGTADDAMGSHDVIHLFSFPFLIHSDPLSTLCCSFFLDQPSHNEFAQTITDWLMLPVRMICSISCPSNGRLTLLFSMLSVLSIQSNWSL
jgi:hypothetical protein